MARPLRIEFPGTVYHVTARSGRHEDIFVDDEDCLALLEVVALALSRFDAEALAYCLNGCSLIPESSVYTAASRRWSKTPKGGHFAALEQPELLDREGREFFRPLR